MVLADTYQPSVLLIEDDHVDRRQIERLLPDRLVLHHTVSAKDGLAFIQAHHIDCVLLDYRLPDLDGLSFLEAVRTQQGQVSVAVIMLTHQSDTVIAVEAMKRGAADYLIKDQLTDFTLQRAIDLAIAKKQTERSLLDATRKLKQSNEDLLAFANLASHDLQAPLRSITQFIQLIEHKHAGSIDRETTEYIRFIVDGANRMQSLLTAMLDFARTGNAELQWEQIYLNGVVEAAEQQLYYDIRLADAEIETAELPDVWGDFRLLTTVIQNLLANAMKYTTEPSRIKISAHPDGEFWRFSVADNGIGIAPQFLKAVFNPFKRLHTEKKYKGTGIGLATCHKIIELHGGRIWATSTPGEGSTFHFTLPVGPPAAR